MQKISFLGASGEVTGASFVITAEDGNQMLVDLGMFQGTKEVVSLNYQPLQFDANKVVGVVLTHAHLDHCGRLPLLVFTAFKGKIYMTAPTFALVEVILNDAARVAQEKLDQVPLFGPEEVQKTLDMIELVNYDEETVVGPFAVTFKNAGHIIGSASIEIVDTIDKKKALFSGDLGNTPEDIIKPTEYSESADYVIMETTYGDKLHRKEDPSEIIREEINAIEEASGVLLIPAFSLERTQELLHKIHHLKKDGKIKSDTPVFLDSPMGIRATEVFKHFREYYNDELQSHTDDPFSFAGLGVTLEARDSKDIRKAMEPKVIIAGSGMMSGGRILHHALNYLPFANTRVLFVGYQAEETLGRKILLGAKNVRINNIPVKVRAHIREITTMSSHADQAKLLTWINHVKGVKKLFLIHGEQKQREAFADIVKQQKLGGEVILPLNGQEHTL